MNDGNPNSEVDDQIRTDAVQQTAVVSPTVLGCATISSPTQAEHPTYGHLDTENALDTTGTHPEADIELTKANSSEFNRRVQELSASQAVYTTVRSSSLKSLPRDESAPNSRGNRCKRIGVVAWLNNFTPCACKRFIARLSENFGSKFVVALASLYFATKGMIYYGVYYNQLPYYRELGVSGADYYNYAAVSRTPWAMKGFYGALSDTQPVGSYHKRWYILAGLIMGTAALILAASLPLDLVRSALWVPALLFFATMLEGAVTDILTQGIYTAKMNEKPWTGSDIVTYIWAVQKLGGTAAALLVGPLADHANVTVIFWILVPISLQVLIPVWLNWLGDPTLPKEKRWKFRSDIATKHRGLMILATATAASAVVLAILGIIADRLVRMIYCLISVAVLSVLCLYCMPKIMALATIYCVLIDVLNPSTASALEYWYTEQDTQCVPDGPGFDFTYFSTTTNLVSSLFSMLGLMIFQTVMSSWKFRAAFWVTTLMRVVAGSFDLIIVNRLNIAIGIPDKVMYMVGFPIIYEVVYMMDFMPSTILISKVCPKTVEATVYAILAGFMNFGKTQAQFVGTYIGEAFGISTKIPCNYDNLSYYLLLCNFILPLFSIPLTFCMIPDVRMRDPIVTDIEPAADESMTAAVQKCERSGSGESSKSLISPALRSERETPGEIALVQRTSTTTGDGEGFLGDRSHTGDLCSMDEQENHHASRVKRGGQPEETEFT